MVQVFRAVWRFKYLIAGFTMVCVAAAVAIKANLKPVYKSSSKFICKQKGGGAQNELSALASLAGLKGQSGGNSNPSDYFEEILSDDEFLEKILARNWPYKGTERTLAEIWEMEPDKSLPDWEYPFKKGAVSRLRGGKFILLNKNAGNSVFTLDTKFQVPGLAYQVNRFILQLLNQYLADNLSTSTREKKAFIGNRLNEIEAELRKVEIGLAEFREKNKEVVAPRLILEQARMQRALRINEEIYLQLKKEFEMAKIEESNDTPLIEIISKPVLPVNPDPGKAKFIVPIALVLGGVTGTLLALLVAWGRGMLTPGAPTRGPAPKASAVAAA